MNSVAYLALAVVLCVFGFLGLLSIGAPFLLTGIVMLVFFPWRLRRDLLWPALSSIWAFAVTYVILVPSCSSALHAVPGGASPPVVGGVSSCSVLGIDFTRGANYRAPLMPAFVVGIVVGIVVAFLVRAIVRRAVGTSA
jgi:hypothetical protein